MLAVAERAEFGGVEDEAVSQGIAGFLQGVVDDEVSALSAIGAKATGEVIIAGKVDEEIVKKAKEIGAVAIVMGTHGRTGLTRAVIGSVADRVLRHSAVPVVLVPLTPRRTTTLSQTTRRRSPRASPYTCCSIH